MVSSHISQPAKNRLEYKAHQSSEIGSSAFTLFNHTGFLESILHPLSENNNTLFAKESGTHDGFNVEGEAHPRIALHARRIFASSPLVLTQFLIRLILADKQNESREWLCQNV